jgi:hypothetical protein
MRFTDGLRVPGIIRWLIVHVREGGARNAKQERGCDENLCHVSLLRSVVVRHSFADVETMTQEPRHLKFRLVIVSITILNRTRRTEALQKQMAPAEAGAFLESI